MKPKDITQLIKDKMPDIKPEDALIAASKVPGVKIDREKFLKKEFKNIYPEEVIEDTIAYNPAFAGIPKKAIDKIANQVINYETNKVSAISFAAGLPGGFAMVATIPADLAQYFAFILRAMQELAYLYGFEEFDLNEDDLSSDTLNKLMVFLGVMFGVQEANAAVKIITNAASKKVAKTLANKALTKTTIYPIVKKISQAIGIKMTKQIFADSVSKVVPVVGGIAAGTLSYATFKPQCKKLKKSFGELPICDPKFYE